jgi:hypothetical protein
VEGDEVFAFARSGLESPEIIFWLSPLILNWKRFYRFFRGSRQDLFKEYGKKRFAITRRPEPPGGFYDPLIDFLVSDPGKGGNIGVGANKWVRIFYGEVLRFQGGLKPL